jgi:diadenosine tetraphosphate (Ap4A) HIT family hydrolase
MKRCDFCLRSGCLPDRVFYETVWWFAFVSAPPHAKGHTILAAQPLEGKCPREIKKDILFGFEAALQEVTEAIGKCYDPAPKDILLASLRGDITHFHFHLVPLWPEDEQCWRKVTGYKNGHLMEFLGSLEKRHNFLLLECEAKKGKDEETRRKESTLQMTTEIQKLRDITGYHPKSNNRLHRVTDKSGPR